MEEVRRYFTPSRTFLLFWLALLGGLALGSVITLNLTLLAWLAAIWAAISLSGQDGWLELAAIALCAATLGAIVWQLTGGESWLNIHWLGQVTSALTTVRDRIADQVFTDLPSPHSSLLVGILFGNRVNLDPTLVKNFQTVGLSHVIAVSGYNLTILSANTRTLFRPILGQRALWLVLALIVIFTLMTGAPASIVRAAVMAALAVLAELLGRPNKSINALVLAAAVMALLQPKIVFNIGFQLSVAATYGLLRLSPLFKYWLEKTFLPKVLADIIAEGTAAIVMTAPLIIFYFGRLSAVSPITNLLVLPLIPLLMGLGLIGCLLIFIAPPIGAFFIKICWPILALIIAVTNYFAHLSWASLNVTFSLSPTIAAMIVIVGLVEMWRLRPIEKEVAIWN